MTTITGNVNVGTGVPPSALGSQPSFILVRSRDMVTTGTGVTMLPVESRVPIQPDGSFTLTVPPLPDGFAYEFIFSVNGGRWTSSPRYCTVPPSGSITYPNLTEVSSPGHVGWTQPAWVAELLELIASGGAGGGGLDAEAVRDTIGATLVGGAGVSISVDDAANTITITASGSSLDTEAVRDAIGATLAAGTGITLNVDDAANTVTITADIPDLSGYATIANAELTGEPTVPTPPENDDSSKIANTAWVQRELADLVIPGGTFSGDSDDIPQGTSKLFMTVDERTKLGTVAPSATANDTDANLKNRANHTGTQPTSSITGLDAVLGAKADLVGGKIPASQIPAVAMTEFLGAVANQTAMLALVGQVGDWAVRTDLSTVFIITGSDPTQLSSWTQVAYPTAPVTTVAGKAGAVTLVKGDVGLGLVDNIPVASMSLLGTQVAQATTATRGTNVIATPEATRAGTGNGTVTPSGLSSLPEATAEDIPYDEEQSVAEVLAELIAFKEAIEGAGVPITNSVRPTITGDTEVGDVLTATNGTWSQTPDSHQYQWKRNGSAISGATSSTYTLTSSDIGTNTISVTVTAVKSGFSNGNSTSDAVSVTSPPEALGYGTPTTGGIYSGTTVTLAKPAGVTNGTRLLAVFAADLNSGGTDFVAAGGSGTWTRKGPAWPGASAANRIFSIFEHIVTDAASEPANYQFTRTGAAGRNGGFIIPVHGSDGVDQIVSDYLGTSITNGRRTGSLTASKPGLQFFFACKQGTSASVKNPSTVPAGFTEIISFVVNDGSDPVASSQTFLYGYVRAVAAGATGTSDIAWGGGATNPIAQALVMGEA